MYFIEDSALLTKSLMEITGKNDRTIYNSRKGETADKVGVYSESQMRVKINAQSQILIMKRNKSHSVSIEGEFYIKGNNVIMNGSSRETYSPFAERGEDSYHV